MHIATGVLWTALSVFVTVGVVLVSGLCVFATYMWLVYRKYSHIPSPKRPSFLMGHIPNLRHNSHPFHEIYYQWYEDAGPIFVVFFVVRVVVVTLNPEDVKEMFMNPHYGKPKQLYNHFQVVCGERFLGNGLLSETEYDKWKPRRKFYDPMFHKSCLKLNVSKFSSCVEQFTHELLPLADGKTIVPMKDFLHDITTDIISQVAFTSDFSQKWDKESLGVTKILVNNKLHYLLSHALTGIQRTLRNPFAFELLHPFESASYREAVRAIRKIGRDSILRRLQAVNDEEQVPVDILSCILEFARLNKDIELEDLVDDFTTFYTAGQETTANMLCFALILIHQHPLVLEKLQCEVDDVLGNSDHFTAEHLEKLEYMEQVFMETLRLYPPISGLNKMPPKGGIHLSGYHIPEGTLISMAAAVMCRVPEYFDSPTMFNPERFDSKDERPSAFVYFPFGVGHRSCIGRHFAMMEAKAVLGKLLQRFAFTFSQNYKLEPVTNGVLQPKGVIPCIITPRRTLGVTVS